MYLYLLLVVVICMPVSTHTSAAAVEKDVKSQARKQRRHRVREDLDRRDNVMIESGDGKQFALSREIARNPLISNVWATALEGDNAAEELLVRDLHSDELTKFIALARELYQKVGNGNNLSELEKKQIVDDLVRKRMGITDQQLPALLKVAFQLDSPILMTVFAAHYVDYLHRAIWPQEEKNPGAIEKEVAQHNFAIQLKEIIARQYFLRHTENIDFMLGFSELLPISYETLKMYGKIAPDFLKIFPEVTKELLSENVPYHISSETMRALLRTSVVTVESFGFVLYDAVKGGDHVLVKAFVQARVPLLSKDARYMFLAVQYKAFGDGAVLKALLEDPKNHSNVQAQMKFETGMTSMPSGVPQTILNFLLGIVLQEEIKPVSKVYPTLKLLLDAGADSGVLMDEIEKELKERKELLPKIPKGRTKDRMENEMNRLKSLKDLVQEYLKQRAGDAKTVAQPIASASVATAAAAKK
jgi:hypothetical protein